MLQCTDEVPIRTQICLAVGTYEFNLAILTKNPTKIIIIFTDFETKLQLHQSF
jgi:hypothetical protein